MKKIVMLFMVLVLAFSLVACGDDTSDSTSSAVDASSESGKKAVVPNVVGKTVEEAQKDCEFEIVVSRRTFTSQYAEGIIIEQDLAANQEADTGKVLTVAVSNGPVIMPNLVGADAEENKEYLEQNGFTVVVEETNDSTVAAGCIISTTPVADEVVPDGSTITFVVSKGV